MSEPLVYLHGQMVPAAQACLPIYDAGIVQGATISELTRTFQRQPWRLGAHLDRLFRSLAAVHLDLELSPDQLSAIAHQLVGHNGRLLPEGEELGIIHFVTAGEYPTYAAMAGRPARSTPTVCVHTFSLPLERYAEKMRHGAHLVTPSIRQVPAECWSPQIKCRSRMHYFLADQEARRTDPEASALLLDLAGNITDTNTSNFLAVLDGALVSPPAHRILPGISRDMVIELAGQLGIPFIERDLTLNDLPRAQEALITSTPYCLMPVTRINGAPVGDGQPGPVFRRLLSAWSKCVGLDIGGQIQEMAHRRAAG